MLDKCAALRYGHPPPEKEERNPMPTTTPNPVEILLADPVIETLSDEQLRWLQSILEADRETASDAAKRQDLAARRAVMRVEQIRRKRAL